MWLSGRKKIVTPVCVGFDLHLVVGHPVRIPYLARFSSQGEVRGCLIHLPWTILWCVHRMHDFLFVFQVEREPSGHRLSITGRQENVAELKQYRGVGRQMKKSHFKDITGE